MNIMGLINDVSKQLFPISGVTIKEYRIDNSLEIKELSDLESKFEFKLPFLLRDFYINQGKSVILKWLAEPNVFGKMCRRGELNILSPIEIRKFKDTMAYTIDNFDNCLNVGEKADTTDNCEDFTKWIPIIKFSNGDAFCIDVGRSTNPIVFYEHDFIDCNSGLNGITIAQNFVDLMLKWSKLGFVGFYDWSIVVDSSGIDCSKSVFNSLLEKIK